MAKLNGFLDTDFANLDSSLQHRKAYKLADVQDRIERVAFDVVRFKDADDLDKLWVIQEREDGEPVIVAMYDDEEGVEKKASPIWAARTDRVGETVHIFYKGEPITRFAMKSLHLPTEEAGLVCRYLPQKLANDSAFRKQFLSDLTNAEEIFTHYPELRG